MMVNMLVRKHLMRILEKSQLTQVHGGETLGYWIGYGIGKVIDFIDKVTEAMVEANKKEALSEDNHQD